MLFNIHLTKALVLVSVLVLLGIILLNNRIEHNRLEIYQKYSNLILPPNYEVKQNTAGAGNYKTNIVLVFQFNLKHYDLFMRQNKINSISLKANNTNHWLKSGNTLYRKRIIDAHTIILELINTDEKTFVFHFKQEYNTKNGNIKAAVTFVIYNCYMQRLHEKQSFLTYYLHC